MPETLALVAGLPPRPVDAPEPVPSDYNPVERALERAFIIVRNALYSGSPEPIVIDIPSLFVPEKQASFVACSRCRRRLSSVRSKERGLGPLCAKRNDRDVTRDVTVRDVTNE